MVLLPARNPKAMVISIVRRLAVLVPTFIGVTIAAFLFIRLLPGDPILMMSGERALSTEQHADLARKLGFDQPLLMQYMNYLTGVLRGDFGTSISSKEPVLSIFLNLFPATLE